MIKLFKRIVFAGILMQAISAQAALDIEIIGAGANQIPVSIVPMGGDPKLSAAIQDVIVSDLTRSGLFKIIDANGKQPHSAAEVNFADWRGKGAEAISIGTVEQKANGKIEATYRLFDVLKQNELVGELKVGDAAHVRALAHSIADVIYEKLTGDKGVFSTKIAFVNREKKQFRLVVADSDGQSEHTVVSDSEPIMSPSWSPDGSHLAYVSFKSGHAVVYVQSLVTGQSVKVADYKGSNSAPAWSRDGRQLAVVLTKDGNSEIYLVNANGSNPRRITNSAAIDTEPAFSPDGQFLLFTSDRGGSAQIYKMPVEGGNPQRLTFGEGSNFSAKFSPDGKGFVFTHLEGGRFYIATQDFQSNQMIKLTSGGWEKKPSFAPNGKIVLYASEARGRGVLSTVSSDGRVKQNMFAQSGDAREPVWGP